MLKYFCLSSYELQKEMSSHNRDRFKVLYLPPTNPIWEWGEIPPNMSKIILDYLNIMSQSAFDWQHLVIQKLRLRVSTLHTKVMTGLRDIKRGWTGVKWETVFKFWNHKSLTGWNDYRRMKWLLLLITQPTISHRS